MWHVWVLFRTFHSSKCKIAALLFSVAPQKRKMTGMSEMTEPCSAQAFNAHQKVWQKCTRLCSPSQLERPGIHFWKTDVFPLLSATRVCLYPHLLLFWLAVTFEPADWSGTAHGFAWSDVSKTLWKSGGMWWCSSKILPLGTRTP